MFRSWSRSSKVAPIGMDRAAPRVMAMARPAAMPLPMRLRRDVHAFTMPAVYDRWSADAAGIRAVAYNDNVITMFDAIGED